MSKPTITWPDLNGPSLVAAALYLGSAIALVVYLWILTPLAGLAAGVILSVVAYLAAEQHLATHKLRPPQDHHTQPQPRRGEDPEDTWTS
jgi:hypothetical protein